MSSIRHHLLLWQIVALLSVAVLVSLITYNLAWDGFNRTRDYGLQEVAHALARQTAKPLPVGEKVEDLGQFLSQIWTADGQISYSSRPAVALPLQVPGLHSIEWQGDNWHVFVLQRGDTFIQVANTAANRALVFSEISRWMLIPLGILVGLLGALLWMAVGKALRPLDSLRTELGRRGASRLHALAPEKFPEEVVPLVEELNDLLQRIDTTIRFQSRFIADAAHALRTPLTAIKLQSELVLSSDQEGERAEALEMLKSSVDRSAHLLDQLLKLARFEASDSPRMVRAPVRIDQLAKRAVAELSSLADQRVIDLGVGRCDPVEMPGDVEALRAMLDNLIDNAIRYGFKGGRVDLEVRKEVTGIVIEVIDNGPGIPDSDRAAVFDRFVRLADPEQPGSGLGLSIVKEVVTAHGGTISLGSPPGGGLQVTIVFLAQG